ncbi:MAG: hypothetical protein V6Z89_15175 [Desulfobacter sp.]
MVKSIEELKSIIVDGTKIQTKDKIIYKVMRFPNNVIKIKNKPIKWADLQELLANGEFELIRSEEKDTLDPRQTGRGGPRLGSGRKSIDPAKKKKIVSIGLSPDAIRKLDKAIEEDYEPNEKMNRSKYIEMLINNFIK